ncbi:MAG: hypothetical protein IPM89_16270 [Candidatus Competibacteraceae bacterium]|nr:MAG: hypothetical protein IPM89_16270 [Candidatus Competibacteraceae bacterium]
MNSVILATQEQPETALENYKERWPIETLFICLKTRGFDLESTHITDPSDLKNGWLFSAIAFSWAHIIGEWRHEIKPIKIKNMAVPPKVFSLWIRLFEKLFISSPRIRPAIRFSSGTGVAL